MRLRVDNFKGAYNKVRVGANEIACVYFKGAYNKVRGVSQ